MDYSSDTRTVMTLDAGGTNFVFTAIRGSKEVVKEIVKPSQPSDLYKCLSGIIDGFREVRQGLEEEPVAISFGFPGPADYPRGIIGDLPNLPAFRGGVALGPILENVFGLPVFINNDGDLYAYGEAIAGYLPYINRLLEGAGSMKRFKNLLGVTLGTGFGAGIVHDGELFTGDNSIAGEIWLLRDKLNPRTHVEEHVSVHGLKRTFARVAGIRFEEAPDPKEMYDICKGIRPGNREAAFRAFQEMAEVAGDAIANAITLIDGLIVIGGGLAGASEIFLPHLVKEMNSSFERPDGGEFPRLALKVYNLEDPAELERFLRGSEREIAVHGTNKVVRYDPEARTGVGISKIGTSKAISIGAYAFALKRLDEKLTM